MSEKPVQDHDPALRQVARILRQVLELLVGKELPATWSWRTTGKIYHKIPDVRRRPFSDPWAFWRVLTFGKLSFFPAVLPRSTDDFKICTKSSSSRRGALSSFTSPPTPGTSGFKFVCLWPNHMWLTRAHVHNLSEIKLYLWHSSLPATHWALLFSFFHFYFIFIDVLA